jgi:mRNA interferase MazF
MKHNNLIIQRFINWTKLKIRIHISGDINFYFKEREIWYASLGENIGFEENGKNDTFERPVLVFKKFNKNLLWAVPLTSQLKTGTYYYYYYFGFNDKKSSLILPQLRAISSKRLIRKIGILSVKDFEETKERIQSFL